MLQEALLDRQFLNLLTLSQNGFVPAKIDVGGCDGVQALAPLGDASITCRSKGNAGCCNIRRRPDLPLKIAGETVVLQQTLVLLSLVPALDLP